MSYFCILLNIFFYLIYYRHISFRMKLFNIFAFAAVAVSAGTLTQVQLACPPLKSPFKTRWIVKKPL